MTSDIEELSAAALAREVGRSRQYISRVLESGAIPAAYKTDGQKRPQWKCPRWAWRAWQAEGQR